MDKVIIFGAGNNYRLRKKYFEEKYEIVAVIDNNHTTCEFTGVKSPDELTRVYYDKILITPTKYEELYDQLLNMGVNKNQILIDELDPSKYCMKINGNKYYGQHADDLVIEGIFAQIGIEKPSYIDLGVNHPIKCSNTIAFYLNGSRGINVEANPALISMIEYVKPDDITINMGVAVNEGIMSFYKWDDQSGRNTFSCDEVEGWGSKKPESIIELPVTTLEKIVAEYMPDGFPDFLDCDIEGLDYDVLSRYDLEKNGPKVICVEVRQAEIDRFDLMLDKKSYYRFCRIGENNVYVRKEFSRVVSHM